MESVNVQGHPGPTRRIYGNRHWFRYTQLTLVYTKL